MKDNVLRVERWSNGVRANVINLRQFLDSKWSARETKPLKKEAYRGFLVFMDLVKNSIIRFVQAGREAVQCFLKNAH